MLKTDFKTYLRKTSEEIEQELRNFSQDWKRTISSQSPELKEPHKRFTESLFGGKMLRGTLVKLGYELMQTKTNQAILKPAAAFEILHTALLIHDDIIDQSPLRRGKPAVHIMNSEPHYGISQAICLGDIGITTAIKFITESDFPEKLKITALNFFLQTITLTITGEMLDIASPHSKQRNEGQVLQIQKMKTAQYTIIGPLSLGAIFGGASNELLKAIKKFGENLGIAYQIQDDILGVFGNEKTIGKSTTSDIEENKSTLLLTYSKTHATEEQKKIIKQYYGEKGITKTQHAKIKTVFRDTGALTYAQIKIESYTKKAKQTISLLTKRQREEILLTQLADLLAKRNI